VTTLNKPNSDNTTEPAQQQQTKALTPRLDLQTATQKVLRVQARWSVDQSSSIGKGSGGVRAPESKI
jgi:hypothetical protein